MYSWGEMSLLYVCPVVYALDSIKDVKKSDVHRQFQTNRTTRVWTDLMTFSMPRLT